MEFESNYPRERALKESEQLRIFERAYAFGAIAGFAGLLQFLALTMVIQPSVWMWVVGAIGYVGYYIFAYLTGRELGRLDEFSAGTMTILALGSGFLFCLSPLVTFFVFGVWLSVRVYKMGVKLTLRHWSGFDFKGRIAELERGS